MVSFHVSGSLPSKQLHPSELSCKSFSKKWSRHARRTPCLKVVQSSSIICEKSIVFYLFENSVSFFFYSRFFFYMNVPLCFTNSVAICGANRDKMYIVCSKRITDKDDRLSFMQNFTIRRIIRIIIAFCII